MKRSTREPERTLKPLDGGQILADVVGSAASSGDVTEGIDLATMWSHMWTTRIADQLFGQMGLPRFASAAGEESVSAAAALLLGTDDWIYAGQRDRALPLLRGVPIEDLVAQLGRSPDSETKGRLEAGTTSQLAAVAAPTQLLGMHLGLATGHARALKLRQSEGLVLAICGQGLCAHGRFHEAIQLALSSELPIVFIVKNPRWSTQPPAEAGLLGHGIAQRCQAAGMHSQLAEGSDPISVYRALKAGVTRVRKGQGPALVEVEYNPYHSQLDPALDPVARLRALMEQQDRFDAVHSENLQSSLHARFQAAMAKLPPSPRHAG